MYLRTDLPGLAAHERAFDLDGGTLGPRVAVVALYKRDRPDGLHFELCTEAREVDAAGAPTGVKTRLLTHVIPLAVLAAGGTDVATETDVLTSEACKEIVRLIAARTAWAWLPAAPLPAADGA